MTVITVAVAGDSTSSQADCWVEQLADPEIEVVASFARGGYKSSQILSLVEACTADVAVLMPGVNDISAAVPFATIHENIEAIAAGICAPHVLLSAIVPCNITDYGVNHINRKEEGEKFNRSLADLAAAHGWLFVDPCNQFRRLDNSFKAGTTVDGVHPTPAAYGLMAARMAGYIHLAVEGAKP